MKALWNLALAAALSGITGSWSGEHISLELKGDGARVEYDCAHGTVDRAIVPDRKGRFDVRGTHVEEHGGPVRREEPAEGSPVRFRGRVSGTEMEFTVTRISDGEVIGTFTLERGRESSLMKCR
jgi:hypothetical protein